MYVANISVGGYPLVQESLDQYQVTDAGCSPLSVAELEGAVHDFTYELPL